MATTIKQLNEKPWYRLLKVAFVGFFGFATLLLVGEVVNNSWPHKEIDGEKTVIVCHYGNMKTIVAKDTDLIFESEYFTDGVFSHHTMNGAIQDVCGITFDEALGALRQGGGKLFDVYPTYTGGWIPMALRIIFIILIMFGISEALRRVFYYVILGTFKPKG